VVINLESLACLKAMPGFAFSIFPSTTGEFPVEEELHGG
jgi:hypothetical protein